MKFYIPDVLHHQGLHIYIYIGEADVAKALLCDVVNTHLLVTHYEGYT